MTQKNYQSKRYSYILVALQFIFIALLVVQPNIHTLSITSFALFALGIAWALYTLKHNPLGNFNITPEIKHNASLITNGAYRYIRHPMYFSVLLMMLGVLLSKLSLLNSLIYLLLVVTLFLKAKKEEMLWMEHSLTYQNYMKKTKCIIPFVV